MTQPASHRLVDPQLHGLLAMIPNFTACVDNLADMRRTDPSPFFEGVSGGEGVEQSVRFAPGLGGAPDVKLFIDRPAQAGAAMPCILHMHGGGYIGGTAIRLSPWRRIIAGRLACVIVSVEYRLAPEHPFPAAIEDCYAALSWLVANAPDLGVDPSRIGVMGESAGAGLAASLALMARDRGEYALAFQHLIYPMIDDRTCVHPDPHPHVGEFVWTAQSNRFGWASLLGVEPGSPGISPYAAAARAEDLTGLPRAYISTGALDLFLEEDIEYARRLLRAGVPTELHVFPGAFHAFDVDPSAEVSAAARAETLEALARAMRDPLHGYDL